MLFVMIGKVKKLTDHLKGLIEAFSKTGICSRTTVIKIGRKNAVVINFINRNHVMAIRILENDLTAYLQATDEYFTYLYLLQSTQPVNLFLGHD